MCCDVCLVFGTIRLHLPGEVVESDLASGEYQADITSFVVKCPKKTCGEHFDGLDMITKLLTPSGDTQIKHKVGAIEICEITTLCHSQTGSVDYLVYIGGASG